MATALVLWLGVAQVVAPQPAPKSPARRMVERDQRALERLFAGEPTWRFTPYRLRTRVRRALPRLAQRLWPETAQQAKVERLEHLVTQLKIPPAQVDGDPTQPASLVLRQLAPERFLVLTPGGQLGVAKRLGVSWVVRRPHAGGLGPAFAADEVEASLDRALAILERRDPRADATALRFIAGTLVLW